MPENTNELIWTHENGRADRGIGMVTYVRSLTSEKPCKWRTIEGKREEKKAQNKMNEKYLVVFAFLLPLKTLYDTHQCGWDSVAFFIIFLSMCVGGPWRSDTVQNTVLSLVIIHL